jgi:hypothetical protein
MLRLYEVKRYTGSGAIHVQWRVNLGDRSRFEAWTRHGKIETRNGVAYVMERRKWLPSKAPRNFIYTPRLLVYCIV